MSRAWREISADHRYRAWRAFRDWILARDQHACQIRAPGICIGTATHVDHIVPVSVNRDLVMVPGNCRAACAPCNRARGNRADVAQQAPPSRVW